MSTAWRWCSPACGISAIESVCGAAWTEGPDRRRRRARARAGVEMRAVAAGRQVLVAPGNAGTARRGARAQRRRAAQRHRRTGRAGAQRSGRSDHHRPRSAAGRRRGRRVRGRRAALLRPARGWRRGSRARKPSARSSCSATEFRPRPTARSRRDDYDDGWLRAQRMPIVVKASGLAAGKGVVIAESFAAADAAAREMFGGRFGAGRRRRS